MRGLFEKRGAGVFALGLAAAMLALILGACTGADAPGMAQDPAAAATDAPDVDVDDHAHDDEHAHDDHAHVDDAIPALRALALAEGEQVQAVATTNIIADVVAQVGGERVALTSLMPPGTDPHGYTPTPQDLRILNEADVIFVNGLELEESLLPILTNLDRDVPIVSVNVGVDTVEFDGEHVHYEHDAHAHDEHEHDEHAHDEQDHPDHDEPAHGHGSEELTARLLAIADYEGEVHLLNLDTLEIVDSYALAGPARLYPVFNDRFLFAVQTDDNQVNVINSGVEEIGHGDHYHIVLGTPSLAPLAFEADTPIHFAAHGDEVAIFNDGDGTAVLVTRDDVISRATNDTAELLVFDSGRAHHGSAVPMHDTILISIPEPDSDAALPIGMRVLTLEGDEIARFEDCPGLHGEASAGHRVVFGCSDGLLVLHEHDGEWEAAKIENPSGEGRTGSFAAHPHADRLLGNYTRFGVVAIDPRGLTSELIELPIEIRNFYFHPEHTDDAVLLTVDGQLHILNLDTGEVEGSLQVVDSFVDQYRDSEYSDPLPYLQVANDLAFVADQTGEIVVVDLHELAVIDSVSPGVSVLSMAAFGRAEASDALDHDGDDHAHDDDHTHDEHAHDEHAHDEHDEHAHEDEHANDHHHHHDGDDPHTWQSVRNVMVWVENIQSALSALDPAAADAYAANADAYLGELVELDGEIRALVAEIPEANRKLVTDHDSYSYFALDYGFEVIGAVIPSFSTVASPSAQELATLHDQIEAENVHAIFVGTTVNPALAERVAEDLGIAVVQLYSDSLSDVDGPAASYIDFMRYNANRIVEALR